MIRRRVLYRKKSEITPAYSADNLVFTGNNYVDTGMKLCDSKKDFTLFACYTSLQTVFEYNTIIHSIYEVDPYNGFAFDMAYNTGRAGGRFITNSAGIALHSSAIYNAKKCLALRRSGDTMTLFTDDSRPNGAVLSPASVTSYISNNVILGCRQTTSGSKDRFWNGTIHHIQIYLSALTDSQIKSIINSAMS